MKKQAAPQPDKPAPVSVEELAALVERRDRLRRERSEAEDAVAKAITNVASGTYITADGGVVRVYDHFYEGGYRLPPMKKVEFTRPLREIKGDAPR